MTNTSNRRRRGQARTEEAAANRVPPTLMELRQVDLTPFVSRVEFASLIAGSK